MKIAVDLGHGVGSDRGAVGCIAEETIINNVGSKVIEKLKILGHEVIECRPASAYSVGNSLAQRYNKSNNRNTDLFVSIHANAGGGVGTEVFTYGAKELSQARNVLNNIVSLGFRDRGIKDGSHLSVVKNTNAPAMLIEICFVDTQSDVDKYYALGPSRIADAIVKGLIRQTVATNPVQAQPVQASKPVSNWYSRLQSECNRQGFSNQKVDGDPGPITLAGCPTLKYGASGNITKLLQERLNSLGYNCGNIDGDFGDKTLAAVKAYQKAMGLTVDGIVGYNTWKKLLGL